MRAILNGTKRTLTIEDEPASGGVTMAIYPLAGISSSLVMLNSGESWISLQYAGTRLIVVASEKEYEGFGNTIFDSQNPQEIHKNLQDLL